MIAQAWDSPQDKFKQDLRQVISVIEELLLVKNKQYGNSALEPKRIFSKASPKEQLLIRIDDKLSRVANQNFTESDGSDTIVDLIGYLLMYQIAELREKKVSGPTPRAISPIQAGPIGIASSSPVTITSSSFEPNF